MHLQDDDAGVKRSYSSPRRDQQAQETRLAILEAALELFMSQGFQATSVREVAERASVSEQTIYNVVGDKVGLLWNAGMEYLGAGAEADETALLDALKAEPDPIERIRLAARDSRATWESGALELESVVLGPDVRDPRLVELAEKGLEHKLSSTRSVCEILFPPELLHPGLALDDIVHFTAAIDSAATITTLLRLGWDMEQWEAWAVNLLTLFLDPVWVAEHDAQKR